MATISINSFAADDSRQASLFTTRASEAPWDVGGWEELCRRTPPGEIFSLIQELLEAHQDLHNLLIHRAEPPVSTIQNQSPAHAIGLIKDSLSLTVAELGSLFEVSRQTIYDWKKEKTPMTAEAFDKLISLAAVAQIWQKLTDGKAPRFLLDHQGPDSAEESILELCQINSPDWEGISSTMSTRWAWYQTSLKDAFEELGYDSPVQRGDLKRPPTASEKEDAEIQAEHANRCFRKD